MKTTFGTEKFSQLKTMVKDGKSLAEDMLKVFDSLSNAFESIKSLGLVPTGLF